MNSRKIHRLTALIIILALMVPLWSCQRETYPGNPTIALVVKTMNNPFFNDMQDGAEKMADSLKLNLIVQAADREVDVAQQVKVIENLIQRRVDAILLTPSGSRGVIPVILEANKAGIPVLNLDTRVDMELMRRDGAYVATYIGSDNFEGGRMAGKYIAQRLNGQGKVAILEGIPGHETATSRQAGFLEGLSGSPGIQVVASQPANWERNMGYTVFQNILQSNSDVDAVFAANDLMALGAVEAIAASTKKIDDIIIVGFDAHSEALNAIRVGEMDATIAQNPKEIGRLGVRYANELLNGGVIPKETIVEIELITGENIVKE